MPRFMGNLLLRGKIECLTGLHIGGSKEKMEIGGVDSIVVRSPRLGYPYLPGSSIKGKMRHLLEYIYGAVGNPLDDQLGNVSIDQAIVQVFGIGADVKEKARDEKLFGSKDKPAYREKVKKLEHIGLSRLTVRDAMPNEETIQMWKSLGSDQNYTEYKAENTLDRLTSAANPRFIERVVEGSQFELEMVYTAYQYEAEEDVASIVEKDVENILLGLRLLEASALGKSGTRGYGKIQFHLAPPLWVMAEHYKTGGEVWKQSKQPPTSFHGLTELNPDDYKYPGDGA